MKRLLLVFVVLLLALGAASQVAAQVIPAPLPELVEDYANYPATPEAILNPGCTAGSVVGFEFSVREIDTATGVLGPPSPFVPDLDLLPAVQSGDVVTMRWASVAPACVGSAIAITVKASTQPFFDPTRNQLTPRADGLGDAGYSVGILTSTGPGSISLTMPDLSILIPLFPELGLDCDYQIDGIVGVPLRDVGPDGSFFSSNLRQQFGIGPQPPAPGSDVSTVFSDRNSTYAVCAVPTQQTTTTTTPTTTPPTTPFTVPPSTVPPSTVPPTSVPPSTTPPTSPPSSSRTTVPSSFVYTDDTPPPPPTVPRPPIAQTGFPVALVAAGAVGLILVGIALVRRFPAHR